MKILQPPLEHRELLRLKAGDLVQMSGKIFTARDRVYARVARRARPPVSLRGEVVYHCGPLVRRAGKRYEVLSAGPTTSSRLDPMQLEFVRRTGVKALIGKGGIGREVARGLRKLGCIYLAFTGGAGVLAALAVKRVEGVYWRELGLTEALWVLRVEKFGPLVVATDLRGGNLYRRGA
jgi:fumarate hydratase subunit beta